MSPARSARDLLLGVGVEVDLLEALGDGDDMLAAGVGSAHLIELSLAVEEAIGEELEAETVERLTTLGDIDALLLTRGN